jgi:hypothetical protein
MVHLKHQEKISMKKFLIVFVLFHFMQYGKNNNSTIIRNGMIYDGNAVKP